GFSVLEMLNAAEKVIGVNINSEIIERRAGDPASVVASSEKAREILGWKPEYVEVDKIISTAWNWYKKL
ncbi:MAG: UDP-glucose 4-epimerase GalE, partial [Cetobacterium sp.]